MTNQAPQVIKVITALDGAQLEYEVLGDGEPLVILQDVFAERGAFARHRGLSGLYWLNLPSFLDNDNREQVLPHVHG